jgi:hypothetical protein
MVWQVLSPRAGAIASFFLGIATGGLFISKNFTLQTGDFSFSTDDDKHALQLMKQSYYDDCTKHLLDSSKRNLEKFKSDGITGKAKKYIVETTIDYYLIATSHDNLFSKKGIVIFNVKGKPIYHHDTRGLRRDEG